MPFVDGEFDVCICGLGMHHMEVPDVLSEMQRLLKRGGRVVIGCVSAPAFWRMGPGRAMIRLATTAYRLTHRSARAQAETAAVPNLRTAGEWHSLLADSGFLQTGTEVFFRRTRPWFPDGLILTATECVR
jgi:ubiquinone/menaquinone biosynthesis C-methylase UbiE